MAFAGRLRWLDSQIFGRQGRWAFRVILEHGTRPGRNRQLQLTPVLRDALSWVLENVPKAEPRAFKTPAASSYQVFTDGSFEQGTGRLGGVVRSPSGKVTDWFQATVPPDVRNLTPDITVRAVGSLPSRDSLGLSTSRLARDMVDRQ